MLAKDNDVSYKLSNVQVGFSGLLDWNLDYSRLTLLQSLDTLVIVPALHRNTIAFIGMGKRSSYLATKRIKDKFIALDNNNYLFCWDVVTGKLLSVNKLPTRQDYSKYEIFCSPMDDPEKCPYKREWYTKILLVKKEAEQNFDENSYYKQDGFTAKIKNQVLYSQTQQKEFREFRLIEITSDAEVQEHLTFIHPLNLTEKQRLYFDDSNFYMVEKLNHPKVFIYEKEEQKNKKLIRWRFLKRFNKFPGQLENESGF